MISLAAIGIAVGLVFLLVLRKLSNQDAIREIRRQIQACLYELRLFVDEPSLVWRAQVRLLALNIRYLSLMLRPALILAVPMLFLFAVLEPFYGKAPLAISEDSIVTIKLAHPAGPLSAPTWTPQLLHGKGGPRKSAGRQAAVLVAPRAQTRKFADHISTEI